MVLGGQLTTFFVKQQNSRKAIFHCRIVNDNKIVRNTSDGVVGISGLICLVRNCNFTEFQCSFILVKDPK